MKVRNNIQKDEKQLTSFFCWDIVVLTQKSGRLERCYNMISKFSVKRPYTVIVAVVLVIILGVVSFTKMSTDLLPSMELPYAIVMTTYQGASPEQVETAVTKPVEQSMATISNIKEVNSISRENMSLVVLEFEGDTDMNAVSLDMREKLDMIKGYWPDEVGNPTIMKLNPEMMPVMVTAMDSDKMSTAELSELIEDKISPSVEAVEGVASVNTTGLIEENINVIINEDKINKLNQKIQKALDGEFDEAQNKIDQAKNKLETGKNTLNIQRSKANEQLAKAQTALSDGQISLAQKEIQVTSAITNLQTQKNALQVALKELDQQISKMEAQLKQTTDDTAKVTLAAQITELKNQKTNLEKSIATMDKNLKSLQTALKQIQDGKKTISTNLTKFSVQSAAATQQMTTAEIGIAQGETQINIGQQQLDSGKEQAKAAANIKDKLTVDSVKSLLTAQNFEMPAGYITEDNVQYLVRVGDKAESQKDLEDLELMDLGIDGIPPITLSDVADVAVVNNQDDIYCRVNGNNGVIMTMQKQTNYSTADVSDKITDKLKELKKDNKGFEYINIMDQGVYIDMVTGSVIENLLMGAVLAVIILLFFLKDIKPTLVIACSIPLSVVFALVLMYFSGITLNVISLSGLALGVGMLVDNSIVVIENIYRLRKEGVPVKEAAIEGAKGVAGAITSSTLTTISVFIPIIFTTGITKELFTDMGLTIGYSLAASLIVAVTFVPMMSAGVLHKVTAKESKIIGKLQSGYRVFMDKVLNGKVLVVILTLALFVGSVFGATKIGSSLMPSMDSTQMTLSIQMPKGTSEDDTKAMSDTVLKKVKEIPDVESVAAMMSSGNSSGMLSTGGSNTDQSSMYILLKEDKEKTNKEIKREILKKTKKFDCEIEVQESTMDMSALGGSGISVEIKGSDLDKLRKISGDIAEKVRSVEGVQNVEDGTEETTPDIHIAVNKRKAAKYGLTVATVYQQLNQKLGEASEATTIDVNDKEMSVKVGNGGNETMTRNDLKKMKLTGTVNGSSKTVALNKIADFKNSDSLSSISRNQQERTLTVSAELKDGYNIGKVSQAVEKKLKSYEMPKGYSYSMTGEMESMQETTEQIGLMLLLAIAFMYLIMVAQFQSLKSPFIILFTIPMAFTGGFLGLFIGGKDLSAIAMIGFVMLAGIIVNNGIVLVDTINQLMEQGYDLREAIITGGTMRIRPILMTALTTILGLSTMALGIGQGAEMMQPMAIVTIGGLIYGTLLTLIVVPCIYALFHRKKDRKDQLEETNRILQKY